MELLSIGRDFKRATSAWDEFEERNMLLELEKFFRQTDGMRLVVSSGAILDRNFQWHGACIVCAKSTAGHMGASSWPNPACRPSRDSV